MDEIESNVEAAEPEAANAIAAPAPAGSPAAGAELQPAVGAQEEARLLRRLQMMMNMVMGVIAQDNTLSYDDAATMVADARTAALAMFPGKELAYDLIWKPRFQRLMRERFRLV
jgi:recombinational DNA repair protein RecT